MFCFWPFMPTSAVCLLTKKVYMCKPYAFPNSVFKHWDPLKCVSLLPSRVYSNERGTKAEACVERVAITWIRSNVSETPTVSAARLDYALGWATFGPKKVSTTYVTEDNWSLDVATVSIHCSSGPKWSPPNV